MNYNPDEPYPPGHFYLLPTGGLACNTGTKYLVYRADYNKRMTIMSRVGPKTPDVKALGFIPRQYFE